MKTVRILLNIGTTDVKRLQLKTAYLENEVVELDANVADILIKEGKAVDFNSDEERARLERDRHQEVVAAIPQAERELRAEEIKKEAKELAAKARVAPKGASSGPSPQAVPVSSRDLDTNPHDQPLAPKK